MTLAELIAGYAPQFYPQTWYDGQTFLGHEADEAAVLPRLTEAPPDLTHYPLPTAATLALLYLRHPEWHGWDHYIWTADTDDQGGQRVYVGQNGRGFEIHRHLHLTDRWAVPVW